MTRISVCWPVATSDLFPVLDAEHFQLAHRQRLSGLADRSHGFEVFAGGGFQEVDLVLHGENLGAFGNMVNAA